MCETDTQTHTHRETEYRREYNAGELTDCTHKKKAAMGKGVRDG